MSRFAIVMFQGTPCIFKILISNNLFINDAKVTSSDTKKWLRVLPIISQKLRLKVGDKVKFRTDTCHKL